MKKNKFFTLTKHLTLTAFLLTSCGLPFGSPTQNKEPGTPINLTQNNTQRKTYQPYGGPVSLKINTGLKNNTTGKVVDLNQVFEKSEAFSTQSVLEGNIVFQETFTKDKADLEETREIQIPDTRKRYTLHVKKSQRYNSQVQVNINGTNVIKETDFKYFKKEAQNNTLLLNATNSLRVRLKGKKNNSVTVTLVEGGESGTTLRRRGKLGRLDETHATHVKRNDTNIFNPNNPNSLGGLTPFEGDVQSDAGQATIGFAYIEGSTAKLEVGKLHILMQEPIQENIQNLVDNFPIEFVSQEKSFEDTYATFNIDLESVDISSLFSTIKELNTRTDAPALKNAEFSSINTLKTFAVASEVYANAESYIHGLSFFQLGDLAQVLPEDTREQIDPITKDNLSDADTSQPFASAPPSTPIFASSLWWLDDISARRAWSKTKGAGSTVAIIDGGFGIIQDNTDFSDPGKVILASPPTISYLRDDCDFSSTGETIEPCTGINDQDTIDNNPSDPKILKTPPFHGLAVASVLAAQGNFLPLQAHRAEGTVGVAPDTKILPMLFTGNVEKTARKQLERIYNENLDIDVVNMSLRRRTNFLDHYFPAYLEYVSTFIQFFNYSIPVNTPLAPDILSLMKVIAKLHSRNIIVVAAAGNYHINMRPMSPTDKTTQLSIPAMLPLVLSVGAYEFDGNQRKLADFNIFTDDGTVANPQRDGTNGSNYGLDVDIWAPGKGIWTRGLSYDFGVNDYTYQWQIHEGTSFATPMVAATVAMMKSLNKNLSYAEVRDILQSSGTIMPNFFPPGVPDTAYKLDVYQAVSDPRVSGTGPTPTPSPVPTPTPSPGLELVLKGLPSASDIPNNNFVLQSAKYLQPNQTTQVSSNDLVGAYFTDPLPEIKKVSIGAVEVPVLSIVDDLIAFGIPEDLPPGVYDVIIEEAGGGNITLEQALEKLDPAIPPYFEAGPPPSGDPMQYSSVELFNISSGDEAKVSLNGQLVAITQGNNDVYQDVGNFSSFPLRRDQRNEFCFELNNNGGGYTYGFRLSDGQGNPVHEEIVGVADQITAKGPDGNQDSTQGLVVRRCVKTNAWSKPIGTPGQPFWAKISRIAPGTSVSVTDGNSDIHTVPFGTNEKEQIFEIRHISEFDDDFELFQSILRTNSFGDTYYSGDFWNQGYFYFNIEGQSGTPRTYSIELYRGINVIYSHLEKDRGLWGDDGYTSQDKYMTFTFWPNIEPPQGWDNCGVLYDCN